MKTTRVLIACLILCVVLLLCTCYSGDLEVKDLSLDRQLTCIGGCDYDCLNIGKNCLLKPACPNGHQDCDGLQYNYVCGDTSEEEYCKLTSHGWLICDFDPPRHCSPLRALTGACSDPAGGEKARCVLATGAGGPCSGRWLFQCHDG